MQNSMQFMKLMIVKIDKTHFILLFAIGRNSINSNSLVICYVIAVKSINLILLTHLESILVNNSRKMLRSQAHLLQKH